MISGDVCVGYEVLVYANPVFERVSFNKAKKLLGKICF